MHTIKEVLRLTAAGMSQRQIAQSLDLSNGVVAKYQAAAQRASLSWPLPAELDDEALAQRLSSKTTDPAEGQANSRRPPLDFAYLHEQLKRKGVTRQLLWEEYRAEQPTGYGYTQFCFHYQEWKSRLKLVMRQTHRAGEKLFVDYCGPTVQVVNVVTGEVREAQIFVAVLGASNYTYAEATWTQALPDWLGSHTRAFTFFGGVPALVVPDNLLSAVTKPCRYEPLLNTSYHQMLAHYNTTALPARPYHPRDKGRGRSISSRALDPGASAPAHLLRALRSEPHHSAIARRTQSPTLQETARLPPLTVRNPGPAGAPPVTGPSLRVRRLASRTNGEY